MTPNFRHKLYIVIWLAFNVFILLVFQDHLLVSGELSPLPISDAHHFKGVGLLCLTHITLHKFLLWSENLFSKAHIVLETPILQYILKLTLAKWYFFSRDLFLLTKYSTWILWKLLWCMNSNRVLARAWLLVLSESIYTTVTRKERMLQLYQYVGNT